MLLAHEARSEYVGRPDFVFAGASGKPRWPDIMLSDHIKPAATKAGIGKIGWQTFRHTCTLWVPRQPFKKNSCGTMTSKPR